MKVNTGTLHSPSRRDLLKANISTPTSHIASLVVQVRPEHIPAVTPKLDDIPSLEVHASANTGRMVVTIEADDDQHLMDLISAIQGQEHVINASLVYHQIEDE